MTLELDPDAVADAEDLSDVELRYYQDLVDVINRYDDADIDQRSVLAGLSVLTHEYRRLADVVDEETLRWSPWMMDDPGFVDRLRIRLAAVIAP